MTAPSVDNVMSIKTWSDSFGVENTDGPHSAPNHNPCEHVVGDLEQARASCSRVKVVIATKGNIYTHFTWPKVCGLLVMKTTEVQLERESS